MVAAPRETVGVGPAVPVVALSGLPAPRPPHLLLLALHPVVAVVVLEGRRTQGPTVVLPLRLTQQLLLKLDGLDVILVSVVWCGVMAHMLTCLCLCERKPPWL